MQLGVTTRGELAGLPVGLARNLGEMFGVGPGCETRAVRVIFAASGGADALHNRHQGIAGRIRPVPRQAQAAFGAA
jgi:hypothetical protein